MKKQIMLLLTMVSVHLSVFAASGAVDWSDFPQIEGELLDPNGSADNFIPYNSDFGRNSSGENQKIVRVKNIEDVKILLRYAHKNNINLRFRGKGHTSFGQTICSDCIVIVTENLKKIEIDENNKIAIIEPGATWEEVSEASQKYSLLPVTLTQHTFLTVGGTLSAGGVGPGAHQYGAQIYNIDSYTLIDEAGIEHIITPDHPKFFLALGGLGQFGFISSVRTKLKVFPASSPVTEYSRFYPLLHFDSMMSDLQSLFVNQDVTGIKISIVPATISFGLFSKSQPINSWDVVLSFTVSGDKEVSRSKVTIDLPQYKFATTTYASEVERQKKLNAEVLKAYREGPQQNLWTTNILSNRESLEDYLHWALGQLSPIDFYNSPLSSVEIFPLKKTKNEHQSMFQVAGYDVGEVAYMVGVFTAAEPGSDRVQSVRNSFAAINRIAKGLYGKSYAIDYPPEDYKSEHCIDILKLNFG